uniref:Uncharacterized protein n=1 Tax=Meloidogyne javanica TaxID=6303 RepID=A0A915LKL3_MELJA
TFEKRCCRGEDAGKITGMMMENENSEILGLVYSLVSFYFLGVSKMALAHSSKFPVSQVSPKMVFWKSSKEKQLEEELAKIKEEFNEFKESSGRLIASSEEKNAQLSKEIVQLKDELLETKNALDNAGEVILKMEEELKSANDDMTIKEALLIDKQEKQEKSEELIADLKNKIKELEHDKLKLSYDQGLLSVGTSGTGYQRFSLEQLAALRGKPVDKR